MVALLDRDPGAAVFVLPGRVVTAGQFAADALRLADRLPDATHVANLCRARYAFAVAFAAALVRGQVSVLGPAQPGLTTLTDERGAGLIVPPPGTDAAPIPDVPADRLAALVTTSGSTGEPTVHRKLWGDLVARSRAAAGAFDPAGATVVGTVPPQHMYGLETTVLLPLHAATSSWCGPAFYPADIRAALAAIPAPRWLITTPLQLRTLLLADADLPPITRIISATAPLDAGMAAAAERRWGTQVREIFGATEIGSIAHRRTVAGEAWTPYPGMVLRPEGDAFTVGGIALADLVELSPDATFRLLGRRSDLVKLGGRRASLAALNRSLLDVDGVEDGVFVPPGDAEHGPAARMTAFVVAPGCASAAILAGLRGRIDPVFLPRRIVHVERLPRNELGKLPHTTLAALRALA